MNSTENICSAYALILYLHLSYVILHKMVYASTT